MPTLRELLCNTTDSERMRALSDYIEEHDERAKGLDEEVMFFYAKRGLRVVPAEGGRCANNMLGFACSHESPFCRCYECGEPCDANAICGGCAWVGTHLLMQREEKKTETKEEMAREAEAREAEAALTVLKREWPLDSRTHYEFYERLYEWRVDCKAEGVPDDLLLEVAATSLGWSTDDVDDIFDDLGTFYSVHGSGRPKRD